MAERRIEIRQFRKSDLTRLLQIENLCFPSEAWDRQLFLEYFARYPNLFLVAKFGRRIAGYAITCAGRERAELASIAVDPAFRAHGVGAALIKYTAVELQRRQVRHWCLMVRITNESAIRFYRRFGFVRTRTVRGYYEAGGDAWRMSWKLLQGSLPTKSGGKEIQR